MKKYLPVILLLAVVTLSACETKKTDTGKTENKEKVENTESKKSLKELLGLGTSQKCTYEINQDGESMKGEIIVNSKKFKQTTEIKNDQGVMKVYSISDGIYYYSWSDAMKGNGTKMNIADLEKEGAEVTETAEDKNKVERQSVNINERIDYKCAPATLSDNDLALPSDVKFVDYTEMMKGFQNGNFEDIKKLIPSETEGE